MLDEGSITSNSSTLDHLQNHSYEDKAGHLPITEEEILQQFDSVIYIKLIMLHKKATTYD